MNAAILATGSDRTKIRTPNAHCYIKRTLNTTLKELPCDTDF